MPSITYVRADGERRTLEARVGVSVMQVAVDERIDGIVAECGGNAMCATCHVYVDPQWEARVPPITPDEDDMLDSTSSERRPSSRLSCQLMMTAALDGLVVHMPATQI